MRKERLIWLGLALVVSIGAWLRLRGLTTHGLWFDEWITVEQSTRASLWESITASGTHPPLLRLLVRSSIALFGTPNTPGGLDFAARLPSALLGVLTLPFLFLFARRWARGSASIAITAAALYAVSPYGIYYGQEARYYAGMVLFAAWTLHALACLSDAPRSIRHHVYLAVPLTLGLLNHHLFGLLFVLTFAVTLPHLLADLRQRWVLATPWVVAGLLFLPWFVFAMGHLEPQARPWLPDLPSQWHDTGVAFFTGRMGAFHLVRSVEGPQFYKPLSQAAWTLLGAGFSVHLIRRWPAPAWRSAVIVGLALSVTAGLHAGGQTTKFFHHKYLAFVVPFACLSLAELLVFLVGPRGGWSSLWALVLRLRSRRTTDDVAQPPPAPAPTRRTWAIAALWLLAFGLALVTGLRLAPNTVEAFQRSRPGAHLSFIKQPYRETARWVEKHRGKQTLVVVWDPFRRHNNERLLRYYGVTGPMAIYKWHQLEHPASFWAKYAREMAVARDVIVITAQCSDAQRRRVETTLAWGFARRVHTQRFAGAEGIIHATRLAPAQAGRQ